MAHVFISYSSTDRDIAQALATELETNNLSVWWDFRLVGGQTFRKAIDQELNAAWAVVVIWSESSVESRFVIDEADVGLEAGKLVTTKVEPLAISKVPLGFRSLHTIPMRDFERVREAVLHTVERERGKRISEIKVWLDEARTREATRDQADDDALREEAEEENCWYNAVRDYGYESYLDAYPDGRYAEEAREILEEDEAWEAAGEDSDYELYLENYPEGRYAAEARAAMDERDSDGTREEEPGDDEEKRLFDRHYGKWDEEGSGKKKPFWPDD